MSTKKKIAVLATLALGTMVVGCGSSGNQVVGTGGKGGAGGQGGGNSQTTTETITIAEKGNPKVDILFVLDNGSSTAEIKGKLYAQLPLFLNVLQSLPTPPDLHLAIATTDMGAPSDVMATIMCTAQGDNGAFQSAPRGMCTSTTLMNGATYLADDGNGVTNFTDPIASVLQCISLVGHSASGFPNRSRPPRTRSARTTSCRACRPLPRRTSGFCDRTPIWPSFSSSTRTTAR